MPEPNGAASAPVERSRGKLAAILGALVVVAAGITTILGAADKLGETLRGVCRTVHLCATPAPQPPTIPEYVTEWVEGHHTWAEFCLPRQKKVQADYPDWKIEVYELPEQTREVGIRHFEYKYTCGFRAVSKSS